MKKFFVTLGIMLFFTFNSIAQKFEQLDTAPTDISYLREGKTLKPSVKVIYSRPTKTEKTVFGHQIPYNEIWRTGSNEATEIKFYTDTKFGNKTIKAGTYTLHTIPGKKEWTVILNSNTDTWGTAFYNKSKDIARIKVPVKNAETLDVFSIHFKKNINKNYLVLAWDTVTVEIPIKTQEKLLAVR